MESTERTPATEEMTARTQGWEAMTVRLHEHRAPSRTALAARSLAAAGRLPTGSPERAAALRAHLDRFSPRALRREAASCPLH